MADALLGVAQISQDNYDTLYGGTSISGYSYESKRMYAVEPYYFLFGSGNVSSGSYVNLGDWTDLYNYYDFIFIKLFRLGDDDYGCMCACITPKMFAAIGSGYLTFNNSSTSQYGYCSPAGTGNFLVYNEGSTVMIYEIWAVKL